MHQGIKIKCAPHKGSPHSLIITATNRFYHTCLSICKSKKVGVRNILETIQGPDIRTTHGSFGPTFGCFSLENSVVEEEFGGCELKFVCNKKYFRRLYTHI